MVRYLLTPRCQARIYEGSLQGNTYKGAAQKVVWPVQLCVSAYAHQCSEQNIPGYLAHATRQRSKRCRVSASSPLASM